MSTLYMIMAYGGLAMTVISLVVAIILFIRWDIPRAMGELTGRTQRRAIAKLKNERNKDMLQHDSEVQEEERQQDMRRTVISSAAASEEDVTDVLVSKASQTKQSPIITNDGEEVTSVLTATAASEEEVTTVLQDAGYSGEAATTVLGTGNNREIITIPDEEMTEPGTVKQILELIVVHTKDIVA